MLNEFRKTLAKVIHLRSIIGYNGLVYALKKTPVIGRIIPDRLYSTKFLKVIYWVFHIIVEVFKMFIGKIFGLGMIYLVSLFLQTEYLELDKAAGMSAPYLYSCFALLLFMVYALFGLLINRPYFKCTQEKEYLVFMLRMNAGKLNDTLFAYDLFKLVTGYLIAGIIALFSGAPFWLYLGIPVLAVFIRLFGTGAQAFAFRLKHRRQKPMKDNTLSLVFRICAVLLSSPFIFAFIVNGYYIPLPLLLAASGVFILLGIWGFTVLKGFDSGLHRRALNDNIVRTEVSMYKSPDMTKSFKKLKAKGSVRGNKKGFEYLNALFVKRHGNMLIVKSIVFTVITFLIMGLMIFGFVYGYYLKFGSDNCLNMVGNNLLNLILFGHYEDALMPFDAESSDGFFRWLAQSHMLAMLIPVSIADNSFKSTQAMYINCDNSLMTFSFFKQREKIIRLFDIRFKQLIMIHLAPSIAFGLFADLILFYTGGQDYPFQYLLTILVCVLMSVIYSMIWLSMYYLFQPFTTTVTVKSGMYNVIRIILFFVFSILVWIPSNTFVLTLILLVFTAVFVFVMRKAVYRHAPKTWKART